MPRGNCSFGERRWLKRAETRGAAPRPARTGLGRPDGHLRRRRRRRRRRRPTRPSQSWPLRQRNRHLALSGAPATGGRRPMQQVVAPTRAAACWSGAVRPEPIGAVCRRSCRRRRRVLEKEAREEGRKEEGAGERLAAASFSRRRQLLRRQLFSRPRFNAAQVRPRRQLRSGSRTRCQREKTKLPRGGGGGGGGRREQESENAELRAREK